MCTQAVRSIAERISASRLPERLVAEPRTLLSVESASAQGNPRHIDITKLYSVQVKACTSVHAGWCKHER